MSNSSVIYPFQYGVGWTFAGEDTLIYGLERHIICTYKEMDLIRQEQVDEGGKMNLPPRGKEFVYMVR